MVKSTLAVVFVVSALLGAALLGGCRTPEPAHAPGARARLVDLSGTLKLIDNTPVVGADIAVSCSGVVKQTTTDARGRFALTGVPEGSCKVTSRKANITRHVRASSSVLGNTPSIALIVRPYARVILTARNRRWVIDEAIHGKRVAVGSWTLEFSHGTDGKPSALLDKGSCRSCKPVPLPLKPGIRFDAGLRDQRRIDYVMVERAELYPFMPIALRSRARTGAIFKVPLVSSSSRSVRLKPTDRQLVFLADCRCPVEHVNELEHLASTYGTTGLKASVLEIGPCSENSVPLSRPGVPIYHASAEALWALDGKRGEIVLLEADGKVIFRGSTLKGSATAGTTVFDDAVAFLERTWPPFAARRRVSVNAAASVRTAEAVRLTGLVDEQLKLNNFPAAHHLLDRLILHSPDLAEAHKLRALVRARLGDYTGAMREVEWWRVSFGNESADDLMDQVRQASRGRLGALRTSAR
jgi:hypothetical protein